MARTNICWRHSYTFSWLHLIISPFGSTTKLGEKNHWCGGVLNSIYFTKSLSHAVALVAARCISCSKVHGFFKVPQTLSKLTVWNVVSMGVAGGRAEAAARGCISCSGSETSEFLETDFRRASLGFSHVIAMSYIRLIDLFPKILG